MIGKGDISFLVGDADMAACDYGVADLVVRHLVGEQNSTFAVDLDMTVRRDQMLVGIVGHVVRLEQELTLKRHVRRRLSGTEGRKRQRPEKEEQDSLHPSS